MLDHGKSNLNVKIEKMNMHNKQIIYNTSYSRYGTVILSIFVSQEHKSIYTLLYPQLHIKLCICLHGRVY